MTTPLTPTAPGDVLRPFNTTIVRRSVVSFRGTVVDVDVAVASPSPAEGAVGSPLCPDCASTRDVSTRDMERMRHSPVDSFKSPSRPRFGVHRLQLSRRCVKVGHRGLVGTLGAASASAFCLSSNGGIASGASFPSMGVTARDELRLGVRARDREESLPLRPSRGKLRDEMGAGGRGRGATTLRGTLTLRALARLRLRGSAGAAAAAAATAALCARSAS